MNYDAQSPDIIIAAIRDVYSVVDDHEARPDTLPQSEWHKTAFGNIYTTAFLHENLVLPATSTKPHQTDKRDFEVADWATDKVNRRVYLQTESGIFYPVLDVVTTPFDCRNPTQYKGSIPIIGTYAPETDIPTTLANPEEDITDEILNDAETILMTIDEHLEVSTWQILGVDGEKVYRENRSYTLN